MVFSGLSHYSADIPIRRCYDFSLSVDPKVLAMVKIYTKTGDDGDTGLFGGLRLSKDNPRIEAYGTIDELNAVLGLVRSCEPPEAIDEVMGNIQRHLFVIGAELASPGGSVDGMAPTGNAQIKNLENTIDQLEAQLPPLEHFILPGGTSLAAHLHLARTICRRAERRLIALLREQQNDSPKAVLVYLNRLGDLLFVLAREANRSAGRADVPWNRES